ARTISCRRLPAKSSVRERGPDRPPGAGLRALPAPPGARGEVRLPQALRIASVASDAVDVTRRWFRDRSASTPGSCTSRGGGEASVPPGRPRSGTPPLSLTCQRPRPGVSPKPGTETDARRRTRCPSRRRPRRPLMLVSRTGVTARQGPRVSPFVAASRPLADPPQDPAREGRDRREGGHGGRGSGRPSAGAWLLPAPPAWPSPCLCRRTQLFPGPPDGSGLEAALPGRQPLPFLSRKVREPADLLEVHLLLLGRGRQRTAHGERFGQLALHKTTDLG